MYSLTDKNVVTEAHWNLPSVSPEAMAQFSLNRHFQ